MKHILITSTILIAVILLLRLVLRKRVSRRLIYATWLLVVLRLLIPFQFGQSEYSVATVTDKLEQQSTLLQQAQQSLQQPVAGPSREELYQQLMQDYLSNAEAPDTSTHTDSAPVSPTVTPALQEQLRKEANAQIFAPTLAQILRGIWICGMIFTAGWFLTTNLLFLRRAKKEAIPCTEITSPIRIRISPNVSTPCLAGLFRPLVYLTPASVADPQIKNHVLTHELTHLKHADHIWAWVRCLCLCIYWFNPLVWIAAIVSKRDCELACDEAVLKKLGESQRIAYGRTLLDTVTHSSIRIFQTTTAMSESKKQLKERVNFTVRRPKNMLIAAVCLVLAVSLTAALVFIGCKSEDIPVTPSIPLETQPQEQTDPPVTQKEAPTEESLIALLQEAKEILAKNDTIKLDPYPTIKDYFGYQNYALTHSPALTISDDSIVIRKQFKPADLYWTEVHIYAVFLDLLLDRYADDVTPIDIHYDMSYNRSYIAKLFLYPGWKDVGYDNIMDYYAAIDAGKLSLPADAFYVSYHSPNVHSVNNSGYNLCTRVLPPIEITSSAAPEHARTIAMDAIDDYLWYKVVGVCCDYEYVNADMSQYLTEAQKEHYHNNQYKITCCQNAQQVRSHIDHRISADCQISGYPDDKLFTDATGNLYLIVTPTDYNGYQHCQVLSESDERITARTCRYDEDGCYSSEIFTLEATENGYQITAVHEDKQYQCATAIVDQGPTYIVLKHGASFYSYQLYNEQGDLVVSKGTDIHCPTVTPISDRVTEISFSHVRGILPNVYWDMQTLSQSEPYDYVIAVCDEKIAYLDGELDNRTLVVCDIFDRSTAQTFTDLDMSPDVMPVFEAFFSDDDSRLTLTYWIDKDTKNTVSLYFTQELIIVSDLHTDPK